MSPRLDICYTLTNSQNTGNINIKLYAIFAGNMSINKNILFVRCFSIT